jgi:hypothetical protein
MKIVGMIITFIPTRFKFTEEDKNLDIIIFAKLTIFAKPKDIQVDYLFWEKKTHFILITLRLCTISGKILSLFSKI